MNGRDPFNQNSNRSDREKRTTSKGGPVFPKLFRLDRTDPLSFGPKFPESLVEWIAPNDFPVIGDLVVRTGLWDRQGANIASRYKEMYGVELFLRLKAVSLDRECRILP